MRLSLALLALSLATAAPAVAQRAPTPALLTSSPPVPSRSVAAVATPWDSLSSGQRDGRRALWATGGALLGLAAGGAAGVGLARADHRPADQREMDFVGVVALAAVGETLGVTVAAAAPGGRGRGACRGDVRLLRSIVGTAAGTGAVALFASRAPAAYLLLPVGQVAGAVLALGGC